jgi:orotate phosphoribosyltransferase
MAMMSPRLSRLRCHLSTSVEFGDAIRPNIVVTSEDRLADFRCEFARRCFSDGDFRTRSGRHNKWFLDCKKGFGDGAATRNIATELVRLAGDRGVSQFAGLGFGAYVLVGGILAVQGAAARGALIRSRAKKYGKERLIEGDLDSSQPVCIVDDILNSGASTIEAASKLREQGFDDLHHICAFHFEWGEGIQRLKREDIESSRPATVRQAKLECIPSSQRTGKMTIDRLLRFWRQHLCSNS